MLLEADMADFKVRTLGKSDPHGKPRVYFVCHPADFNITFDWICEDVFRAQDCAIYYTENMSRPLDKENVDVDLGRMNLVIVPVTSRLLNERCRAMSVDIAYAKKKNIPILPFMMEFGLDSVYSLAENFGDRQYISPVNSDGTEVSYQNKLRRTLESILISDELAARVREAFDAYVFLSYRKKDRFYANELMRKIHDIPGCRDIAIWYDEFLTPGESFMINIERAMEQSELFVLLVTPSLLEDGNFVMREEYPAAVRAGMDIIPTEMVNTSRYDLKRKFKEIPEPLNPSDARFSGAMLRALSEYVDFDNDSDPEHNYLIGVAYLEGIDVEVDVERGIELITLAARAGYPEAMLKICNMYQNGEKVPLDFRKALIWGERLYDVCLREYGEDAEDTVFCLNNLSLLYNSVGDYQKAIIFGEKAYRIYSRILGPEHPDTVQALNNLSNYCIGNGDYKKAYRLCKTAYEISRKINGEESPDTILYLNNLSVIFTSMGNYKKAVEIIEKVYSIYCKTLGEEHPNTLLALNNLAFGYFRNGETDKAIRIYEDAFALYCRVLGEEYPLTLTALANLANAYNSIGNFPKAIEVNGRVLELSVRVLGEEHPDTLLFSNNQAHYYNQIGEHEKSLEIVQNNYEVFCRLYGEEHPHSLLSLYQIGYCYIQLEDYRRALEIFENLHPVYCRIFGEGHPESIPSLVGIAWAYEGLGDYRKAVKIKEKAYEIMRVNVGEEHPDTLGVLSTLASSYYCVGEVERSLALYEKLYHIYSRLFGEDNFLTQQMLESIEYIHSQM